MSNLYNLEPQPTAKVVLQTTTGDLTLELFAKQTPLASRNFLQHCLDGYYTNTIFHRLVPNFIIQGGDPTATGTGGVSALSEDGAPFQDEFHSRLKFNRRGLLGMANDGTKDNNGSQFFLTLGATPELQGKHTMFGRIEGDTIYNLMKMAEAEMTEEEGSERPLYPTKVTGAEVLVNPFEDMVARVREAPRTKGEEGSGKGVKKRKKPAGKNVLSFGGDEGKDGEAVAPVLKKAKANPKMVSAGVEEPESMNNTALPKAPKEKVSKRKSTSPSPPPAQVKPNAAPEPRRRRTPSPSTSPEPEASKQTAKLEQTNAEIAALKASMKRNVDAPPKEDPKPLSALEAMIPTTSTRGRKRGKAADEKGAIDLFKAFKQRLEDLPPDSNPTPTDQPTAPTNGHTNPNPEPTTADDEEADLCDLHFIANCQSCRNWDEENKPDAEAEADGEDDGGWMAHSLTFAKDTLGKDLEWRRKMEEIEVIDPREKARGIREEGRRGKDGGKGKEREKGKGRAAREKFVGSSEEVPSTAAARFEKVTLTFFFRKSERKSRRASRDGKQPSPALKAHSPRPGTLTNDRWTPWCLEKSFDKACKADKRLKMELLSWARKHCGLRLVITKDTWLPSNVKWDKIPKIELFIHHIDRSCDWDMLLRITICELAKEFEHFPQLQHLMIRFGDLPCEIADTPSSSPTTFQRTTSGKFDRKWFWTEFVEHAYIMEDILEGLAVLPPARTLSSRIRKRGWDMREKRLWGSAGGFGEDEG
ncbi:Peptidyl-prolyl isomerase cwc27 [Saxophila tyrrhenica]|uniref:Peptidyl-prolyl isomerase cwc27 n=1 Tax=Saxophila tyrrhenica TaxID=1690608 RepID=A0AAV9P7Y2_9PEZI|nr:Peptidyl-prolyl isomerase cwc27 [Saxophila tyrrhenica]